MRYFRHRVSRRFRKLRQVIKSLKLLEIPQWLKFPDIKTEGKQRSSKRLRLRITSLLPSLLVSDSETKRLVDEMDQVGSFAAALSY